MQGETMQIKLRVSVTNSLKSFGDVWIRYSDETSQPNERITIMSVHEEKYNLEWMCLDRWISYS
jgi:hypothetical protein